MSEIKLGKQVRSDCCGEAVQAMVRVANEKGQVLDLCGHHFRKHEVPLFEQGFNTVVADLRDTLTFNRHKGSENS